MSCVMLVITVTLTVSLHLGRYSCAFMTISKKQTIIADSSTVAEFIGTHAAVKAILWVRNLLSELGYPKEKETTILYQDNEYSINMISHKGNAGRSKHIQLIYNIIRECVAQSLKKDIYCPTNLMTAELSLNLLVSLCSPITKFDFLIFLVLLSSYLYNYPSLHQSLERGEHVEPGITSGS